MLKFPVTYPFKPPEIWFMTPNGRFKTGMAVCLSISNFHPEAWSAAWGVSQIMLGIMSFMQENEITYGGIDETPQKRKILAQKSLQTNLASEQFRQIFTDADLEKIGAIKK